MQPGKWIKDLAPDTAVEDAAWRVLTIRFDTVRETLQYVLDEGKDPEGVHQLRVATRRAGAALWLFRDLVPAKVAKKARKGMKAIRRSAGEVRDGDVLLERLRTAARQLGKQDRPAIDFLIGYLTSKRLPGRSSFAQLAARFGKKLDKFSSRTIESIKAAEPGQTLIELARASLADQLQKFDRALAADSHKLTDLHRVRIIGKRLRYTLEIVAGCFPAALRTEHYPVIEALQEILGEIHDQDVSMQLYTQLNQQLPEILKKRAKRYRPTLERLIAHHQAAIAVELPRFDEWKTGWPAHRSALQRLMDQRLEFTADRGKSDSAATTETPQLNSEAPQDQ